MAAAGAVLTDEIVVAQLQKTGLLSVQELVKSLKPFLGTADPDTKKANRQRFKEIIGRVADVTHDDSGVERLCLKPTPADAELAGDVTTDQSVLGGPEFAGANTTASASFYAHDETLLSAFADMTTDEEATDLGFFSACRLRHALIPDLNSSGARLGDRQRKWIRAAARGDSDAIRLMLKTSPNVNYRDQFTGYTALHWAAKAGDITMLALICSSSDANVNIRSFGGYTPLHLAAAQGHEEAETHLLHFGADASAVDHNGLTPAELRPRQAEPSVVVPEPHPESFRSRAYTAPSPGRSSHGTIRVASKRLLKLFRTSSSSPDVMADESARPPPVPTSVSTGNMPLSAPAASGSAVASAAAEGQTLPTDGPRGNGSENEPPRSPMVKRLSQLRGSLRRSSKKKQEKRASSLEDLSLVGLGDSVKQLSSQDLTFTDSHC
eukprot:m.486512 g.486512  ORF g.486512 m.486512 type:complete len:437 (-) comp24465_c0_seq1:76-1386(-)